ncbi:MAG: GNAT family N-acetyltransferase, partial [Candidatus Rokuibacteriota bacterium]
MARSTVGWMDPADLARLEHENLIVAIATAGAQIDGAHVARADGVAIIATGHPMRLFNQVIIDGAPVAAAVAAAVELMRERGHSFVVNLRLGADDGYRPLMGRLGLVSLSAAPWMPGMALHPLRPVRAAPPPGHEIRRALDHDGVLDHVRAGAEGFSIPAAWMEAIVTEWLLEQPGATLYVGYTDGEPVTTGLGIRTGRTIGVYNIATVESARRRGYGAAMTMRVIDDGAAAGCDVAILQSSAMGYPVYERLGFRT